MRTMTLQMRMLPHQSVIELRSRYLGERCAARPNRKGFGYGSYLGVSWHIKKSGPYEYALLHINSIDNFTPLTTLVEGRNTLLWHFIRTSSMSSKEKYTVILPTYNERRNLPIIIWLLERTFTAQSVNPLKHYH